MNEKEFNPAGVWGFEYHDPADHPADPEPLPEFMANGELGRKGYHVEQVGAGDNFYWVTAGGTDAGFVVTGDGVIAIDAPPILGENMLAAIEEVTDAPVTHVVYSHYHSDHIGAASVYGPNVKIVAHDITRELLTRWPDPLRPIPTETFSDSATLDVGGVKLELSYKGSNHAPGNIFIYAPDNRVLTAVDIVSPGVSVYSHCDVSENVRGWVDAHDQVLDYNFDALIGGHFLRYGTREDATTAREYVHDLWNTALDVLRHGEAASVFFTEAAGRNNIMVGSNNFMNYYANLVTDRVLGKATSTGQKWPERIGGATVNTRYHAWSILFSIHMQSTHEGFQRRAGQEQTWYIP